MVRSGLGLLKNISVLKAQALAVMEVGGWTLAIDAIKAYEGCDGGVLESALGLLKNLTACDVTTSSDSTDYIQMIVGLIKRYLANAGVQKNGLGLLRNLAAGRLRGALSVSGNLYLRKEN